jgi:hypothetical protein
MRKTIALFAAAATAAVLIPTAAWAHPVGEPGTPNCHGQRVSHGSSDHGQTPKERAAALGDFVFNVLPAEDREMFQEFFGVETQADVTVQVFQRFVKINCSDTPLVLP